MTSAKRGLHFGVYVDNRLAVALDDYPMSKLLDAVTTCEELGYDSVWVGESWLAKPRYEPLTTLAAAAALTKKVKLGTGIMQPQHRHPVQLALTWATLDIISSGRTILGVGLGAGNPSDVEKEYELSGIPKRERGKAFEENVNLIRRLWTEERVSYEGDYYAIKDISLGYRPVQKPHPPIWVAAGHYFADKPGYGPMADHWRPEYAGKFHGPLDRVPRLGDGWYCGLCTIPEYEDAWTKVKEFARAQGKDPSKIHQAKQLWTNLNPDRTKAQQEGAAVLSKYNNLPMDSGTVMRSLFGTADDVISGIEAFVRVGVQSFIFVFRSYDPVGQIKQVAAEVLPSF